MDFYIEPTSYPCSEALDKSKKCVGPDKCESETCPLAKGNDDE